ncbi:MAG: hypothetical protein AB7N76_07665 [Planctomycetota bacterium]
MRRALAIFTAAAALGLGLPASSPLVTPAAADVCTYCQKHEMQPGENPLRCPECEKIAKEIALSLDPDKKQKTGKVLPRHDVWLLDFSHETQLGRVQIKDDTGHIEDYWYLLYKLHNPSKDLAHKFFIDIKAWSDRGKHQFWYHDEFVPDVYEEIRKKLGLRKDAQLLSMRKLSQRPEGSENTLPRISDPKTTEVAEIALPTIQPDETLNCLAIFKNFHPEMDELVIRVRGLSNSSLLKHDAYVAPPSSHDRNIKEAVLELRYERPGDEFAHSTDPIRYVGRKWVDDLRTIKSDLRAQEKQ